MWRAVGGRGCRRSAVGTAAETFPEPEPRSTLGRRGREHGVGKALGAADGGRTVRQASQGATYESDGLTANAAQLGTQRSGRRRRRGTARVDRAAAGRSSERHGSGPDAVFGAHLRRHSARMTAGRARSTLANVEIRELQLGPCGAFNCARNQKQKNGSQLVCSVRTIICAAYGVVHSPESCTWSRSDDRWTSTAGQRSSVMRSVKRPLPRRRLPPAEHSARQRLRTLRGPDCSCRGATEAMPSWNRKCETFLGKTTG